MDAIPTVIPLGFYEHFVTRALIQLLPGGGAVDAVLGAAVVEIRADRERTFFNELDKGIRELDEETIKNERFLHAFFATLRAAQATRQREKIRYFSRLLAASTHGVIDYGDDYEDILGVLTETTHRELQTLSRLAALEDQHPHTWLNHGGRENDEARAFRVWPAFLEGFGDWTREHISAHLTRLARTGLYEPLYSGGMGDIHIVGKTTESYRGLATAIAEPMPNNQPTLADFNLSEVAFQDQSTLDLTSAHLRSEVRATITYSGQQSLGAFHLRVAIEDPHDDSSSEIHEIALADQPVQIMLHSTYQERRFGQDRNCRLRLIELRRITSAAFSPRPSEPTPPAPEVSERSSFAS